MHCMIRRPYSRAIDNEALIVLSRDGKVLWGDVPEGALERTQQLWREAYGCEYIVDLKELSQADPPPQPTGPKIPLSVHGFPSTSDLEADKKWIVHLREFVGGSTEGISEACVKGYERALYTAAFARQQRGEARADDPFGFQPSLYMSLDKDLAWHAHMVHPRAYVRDMVTLLGAPLEHVPWPDGLTDEESPEEEAFGRLYLELFGVRATHFERLAGLGPKAAH
mmetsp:Transcript_44657/g.104989  ORF Transcript_44657/g.104989 Transcript_44657/m.104989 type:complete len:224 (-) Transcript_44657:49-720(-)